MTSEMSLCDAFSGLVLGSKIEKFFDKLIIEAKMYFLVSVISWLYQETHIPNSDRNQFVELTCSFCNIPSLLVQGLELLLFWMKCMIMCILRKECKEF